MDYQTYERCVKAIAVGKKLPEAIYIHKSALQDIGEPIATLAVNVSMAIKLEENNWDVLKLYKRDFKITFLSYPDFFEYPYPSLHKSYTVDLAKLSVREASYINSENPPILHRRETFLSPEHSHRELFSIFTKEGEDIGLYENTRTIGFKQHWNKLIERKGYYLDSLGHLQLLVENQKNQLVNPFGGEIDRHKTAISRDRLSVPLFLIAQRGYMEGSYTLLDYGCGRGDDLRELEAHGVDCIGWDPVHRPDTDIEACDIVNLGYVINVIEDQEERKDTLIKAYGYTKQFIIISAMLGNEKVFEKFKPYKDGVITSRKTFQKYYMQGELQNYIETTLRENAIALGPGIFAVFKDKLEEQRYLLERQRTRHLWRQLSVKPQEVAITKQSKSVFEKHSALLEEFWYTCLDFGRLPGNDEFEHSEILRQVTGSHAKALKLCLQQFDTALWSQAQQEKLDDLLVYFSLSHFKKRDAYVRMPQGLQRDIKALLGSYSEARERGKNLLFSLSNPEVIYNACIKAHETLPASQLNGQHDLIFHRQYLNQCPKELRVYVGCATQLYGELDNVSLVKAHIMSGKVSLMIYDNWDKDVPLLTERIKIKLRDQDIDFFDYMDEFNPQPLINKYSYI